MEIVSRLLAAFTEGDYETALAVLDPLVEFDMSIRPEGVVARGHDGVAEAMRKWTGTWDAWKLDVEELVDVGD